MQRASSTVSIPKPASFQQLSVNDQDLRRLLLTAPFDPDLTHTGHQFMQQSDIFDDFLDSSFAGEEVSTSSPAFDDFDHFSDLSSSSSPALNTCSNVTTGWHYNNISAWDHGLPGNHYLAPNYHPQMTAHRRALSNASTSTFDSNSPRNSMTTQHYPAPFPASHSQGFGVDTSAASGGLAYHSPHLPTPARTPTHETSVQQQQHTRRSVPSAKSEQQAPLGPASYSNFASANMGPQTQSWPQPPTVPSQGTIGSLENGWQSTPQGTPQVTRHMPKFNRTESDAFRDELYSPNSYTSMSLPSASHYAHQGPANLQLRAAQQAASYSRTSSPQAYNPPASPFQRSSPYAIPDDSFGSFSGAGISPREQRQAASDAQLQQRSQRHQQATQEPVTVSPRDAFPKQEEPQEESMPSLFPQSSSQDQQLYAPISNGQSALNSSFAPASAGFNFQPPSGFSYPTFGDNSDGNFTPSQVRPQSSSDFQPQYPSTFPPSLTNMETTKSEEPEEDSSEQTPESDVQRPSDMRANRGTYSCTYHNCLERFSTQKELQQHKKEGHRSQAALGSPATPNFKVGDNTQAGPHKCERLNPQTGKPCNQIFSRPYDLTRHEDTIHGERKKVQCEYCTHEKLFSRADALTRHLRLVHPEKSASHRKRHPRV